MTAKFTRRKLAALAASTALLQAQTPSPAGPDEELQAARDTIKRATDALAGQEVPAATEPAFQFKA